MSGQTMDIRVKNAIRLKAILDEHKTNIDRFLEDCGVLCMVDADTLDDCESMFHTAMAVIGDVLSDEIEREGREDQR